MGFSEKAEKVICFACCFFCFYPVKSCEQLFDSGKDYICEVRCYTRQGGFRNSLTELNKVVSHDSFLDKR